MDINRSRDTITSGQEFYNNPFSTANNFKRPESQVISVHFDYSKDTIKSAASTEALNRLQRPSENLVYEPNILFRRIGKYVFLSVAMPPYFLLYGLPKWILIEGFQVIAVTLTWLTKQLKQKVQKPANFIVQKANQLLYFMQMLLKRTIKPVAQFGIQLRQFFERATERLIDINRQLFDRFKKLTQFSKKSATLHFRLLNIFQEISEKFRNQLRFTERLNEAINWSKQIPQLVLNLTQAPTKYFNTLRLNFTQKLINKFQLSTKFASAGSEWIIQRLTVMKNFGLKRFLLLTQLFHYLKPGVNFFNKNMQKMGRNISGFLNHRKKKTLELLEAVKRKMRSLTPQQALDTLLPTSFLSQLPVALRRLLLKFKESRGLFFILQLFLKMTTFTVVSLSTAFQNFVEFASNTCHKVVLQGKKMKNQLKNTAQKSLSGLNMIRRKAIDFLKNALHSLLVIICMAVILLKWGFDSLSEITTRWTAKFSFFKKPTLS